MHPLWEHHNFFNENPKNNLRFLITTINSNNLRNNKNDKCFIRATINYSRNSTILFMAEINEMVDL